MCPVGSVARFAIQKSKFIMARITASLGLLVCVLSQGLSSAVFKNLLFLYLEEGIHNLKSATFETAYCIMIIQYIYHAFESYVYDW